MQNHKVEYLQKQYEVVHTNYINAKKICDDTKKQILDEYDKILDEYQLQNPNISVFELWKKKGNYEPHIDRFTLDKQDELNWSTCNFCGNTKYWSKERRLRNYDIEDLRKIYPLSLP